MIFYLALLGFKSLTFFNFVNSCLDKKTGISAISTSQAETSVNEELAQELHKPLIQKFKRRKAYAGVRGNTWAADTAEMGSLFSFNRGVKYLLCEINIFTKYKWQGFSYIILAFYKRKFLYRNSQCFQLK